MTIQSPLSPQSTINNRQSTISNLRSPSFYLKLLLLVALGVLAAPQLWYPLWFDQGALAACADVLRHGGVMFRDCFDVRGPAAALAYLLPQLISPSPVAVHAFDLVCQVFTAVLIGLLARRLWNAWAGVASGVLYWLLYASVNYWATAQAESFANLFFVLALYAAWRGMEIRDWRLEIGGQPAIPVGWFLLSGACTGLLFWFKYPFLLIGLLPILLILFGTRSQQQSTTSPTSSTPSAPPDTPQSPISYLHSPTSILQSLISFLLGALVILGIGLLYFALTSTLSDLQTQINYDIVTFHDVSLAYRLEWLRTTFWEEVVAFVSSGNTPTAGFKDTVVQVSILGRGYPFVFALMILGVVIGLLRRKTRKPTLYALAYFVLAVLIDLWQGHFYRYHFLIVFPPMALLAAVDFGSWIPDFRLSSGLRRAISNLQSLISTLQSLLWLAAVIGLSASMLPWASDALDNALVQHKSAEGLYMESKLAPYTLVARVLAEQISPQDRIAVFSDVPAIYPLAGRLSGTRFPYVRPLQEAGSASLRAQLAQAYLDDLTRNQPRFFILTQPDFPWPGADFISLWKSLPAIHQYVETNYQYVGENGPFLLFARK